MVITIGGNPGAGKTTLANHLAGALHYEQLYVGSIFRDMAAKKNLSIEQFYAQLHTDPAIERETDRHQTTMTHEHDNLIVQGRIAWYFAKGSPFKVLNILLIVDPATGAERLGKKEENAGKAISEVLSITADRERIERERYSSLYGIENHLDPGHYDLVIDTTQLTEKETFERTLAAMYKKLM